MARIAPSILSADFAVLGDEINQVAADADLLHVDVMDGHFVPNLTIGPPVVAAIRKHNATIYLDCHLMMTNPGDFLEAFKTAGANHTTVHIEVGGTGELIDQMRDLGLDVGLSLNPETRFDAVEPWLDRIDLLLVMTVHPGYGGQSFISEVVPKVAEAHRVIRQRGLDVAIEVDGGIDADTIGTVARAGASVFVAGTAVFGQADRGAACRTLRAAAELATVTGSAVT